MTVKRENFNISDVEKCRLRILRHQNKYKEILSHCYWTFTIWCGSYIMFENLELMTKCCTRHSKNEWQKVLDPLPKRVPAAGVHCSTEAEQIYLVNICKTAQNAKRASCKTEICKSDVQAATKGPYRTIHKAWIGWLEFIGKLPRYSFIITYKIGMTLIISPDMAISEKLNQRKLWISHGTLLFDGFWR